MSPPIVADTGGLLRALARTPSGEPSFPDYEKVLTSARLVIVPGHLDVFARAFRNRDTVLGEFRDDHPHDFVDMLESLLLRVAPRGSAILCTPALLANNAGVHSMALPRGATRRRRLSSISTKSCG